MLLRHAARRLRPRRLAPFSSSAPAPAGGGDDDGFREMVRDFAAREVAPHAEAVDRTNSFPTGVNLWKKMGEVGLLGERRRRGGGGGAARGDGGAWGAPAVRASTPAPPAKPAALGDVAAATPL
jgi:alkylation response protein AidB-like acyl-CoA dehydrogenase